MNVAAVLQPLLSNQAWLTNPEPNIRQAGHHVQSQTPILKHAPNVLGRAAVYATQRLLAERLDQQLAQQSGKPYQPNGFMSFLKNVKPLRYMAYRLAENPIDAVLATVFPKRFSAFKLGQKSGGHANLMENVSAFFTPNAAILYQLLAGDFSSQQSASSHSTASSVGHREHEQNSPLHHAYA